MSEVQEDKRKDIDSILDNAESIAGDNVTYVTQTRFHVGVNEVTLDLYHTSPSLDRSSGKVVSKHTHRLVLPLSLAKELAMSLAQGIKAWEDMMGISLPFEPQNIDMEEMQDGAETQADEK